MTKFKEYLRAKGIKLECDFEVLPYNGIDGIATYVVDDGIVAEYYHESTGSRYYVYDKYGVYSYFFDSWEFHAYVGDPHCDPEFMDWLYDNGFTDQAVNRLMTHYSPLYSSYSVYAAFLHARAGIMDEAAFYKLVSKRCQQTINFYHIDTVLN